jgi:hypothetical protein
MAVVYKGLVLSSEIPSCSVCSNALKVYGEYDRWISRYAECDKCGTTVKISHQQDANYAYYKQNEFPCDNNKCAGKRFLVDATATRPAYWICGVCCKESDLGRPCPPNELLFDASLFNCDF